MRKLPADITALILRLTAGLVFLPHGFSKVFGEGGAAAFAADVPGYGLPAFLGYIAAYAEFFGAALLIVGLLTRLDALLLAGTMAVATFLVQLPDALYEVQPGAIKLFVVMRAIELPLSLLAINLALLLIGAGRFSLDALLRIDERTLALVKRTSPASTAPSTV